MRPRERICLFLCVGLLAVSELLATTLNPFFKAKIPAQWPQNSKLCIEIQADPDTNPPDRSALLKEGMERWQSEMSNRGIEIWVGIKGTDTPPNDCSATIDCTYKPAGSKLHPSDPRTLDGNKGLAACIADDDKPLVIKGGKIIIVNTLGGTDDLIRNLGQHEVTHVLGLADDNSGKVTNHTQGNTANTYNVQDKKEISLLYPEIPQKKPKADGQSMAPGEEETEFRYRFVYSGPIDGHVPLITLGIHASIIDSIDCPEGWVCFNPADPARLDLSYPFYDGYMEDGTTIPGPCDPTVVLPVMLRAFVASSALTVDSPDVEVSVYTVNAKQGIIEVWAGDDIQLLPGPVPERIPTLTEWGMIIFCALLFGWMAWVIVRRRRGVTSGI